MASFFTTPIVHVLLIPLIGAFVLTGFMRLIGRDGSGIRAANASVGASFAWVCALILGTPDFPPPFNSGAILSATVCLLAIGLVLDISLKDGSKFGRLIETSALILCGIGITAWMRGGFDLWSLPILLGWSVVTFRLRRIGAHSAFGTGDGALLLALAAIGLALIAWISGIGVDRDLAFGLSAASLGFFVWNWPNPRFFFGNSILLAGGGGLYMVALRLAEQAPPLVPALLILGFIFFADDAVKYFPQNLKLARLLPTSLKFVILALIPVILAALAALIAIEFPIN